MAFSSPYRVTDAPSEPTKVGRDSDLTVVLVIAWFTAFAMVVGGIARGDEFGAEDTLALLAVIFLPILLRPTSPPTPSATTTSAATR